MKCFCFLLGTHWYEYSRMSARCSTQLSISSMLKTMWHFSWLPHALATIPDGWQHSNGLRRVKQNEMIMKTYYNLVRHQSIIAYLWWTTFLVEYKNSSITTITWFAGQTIADSLNAPTESLNTGLAKPTTKKSNTVLCAIKTQFINMFYYNLYLNLFLKWEWEIKDF